MYQERAQNHQDAYVSDMHPLALSLRVLVQNLGIRDTCPRPAEEEYAQRLPLPEQRQGPDEDSRAEVATRRRGKQNDVLGGRCGKAEVLGHLSPDQSTRAEEEEKNMTTKGELMRLRRRGSTKVPSTPE